MRSAAPEPVDPLAPLEPDELEGIDDSTLDDFIQPFGDEPGTLEDDEPMTDPELAVDLPSEPNAGEQDGALEIDLGAGFAFDLGEEANDDDALGLELPLAPAVTAELDELPVAGDDAEGLDDAAPVVNDRELPDLDADEHGDETDDRRFGQLWTASESALPRAQNPYRVTRLTQGRERCSALAVGGGSVVAASTDLLWLDAGRPAPVRIALDGTRVTSLALLGEDRTIAVAVTAFGRLLRRARSASDAERLPDVRRPTESAPGTELVELRQLGASEPRAVLGRLGSGRLVRSDDLGGSFRALDAGLSAVALASAGTPLVALARDGRALALSFDGGLSWEQRALEGVAREVAAGEAPFLASGGSTLVLADPERGSAVSHDFGATFRQVLGSGMPTACAAGTVAGSGTAWLALYRETSDATDLLCVDAETGRAEVVATLEPTEEHEGEHGAETSRIERLEWDGTALWGTGDPGLVRFEPPAG